MTDLYESEGEEYTNPSYFPINTSESFVNRYLIPTHTNYSPENQTNTRYSLGLSPPLDQQSFGNSSSRKTKNKTWFAQMEKLGTCRNFSGYSHENGETFLKEFESFSTLHELDYEDDESRKLAAFHLHMKNRPALTWYNGLKTMQK